MTFTAWQSLPSDVQKIRTALGGMLYAYEIPLPTITCEDECSTSSTPGTDEEKVLCSECSTESEQQCSENQVTNCQSTKAVYNNVSNGEELERMESKSSGTNSENSSEDSESRLRVQEDWFAEGKKNRRKVPSSPVRKISPKLRKKISPKFGGGFSLTATLRKSSSSSSSMELTEGNYVSNSDSGISLSAENSPKRKTLSVPGNLDVCSRNPSISSTPTVGPSPYLGYCFSGFVVAMHRKIVSHLLLVTHRTTVLLLVTWGISWKKFSKILIKLNWTKLKVIKIDLIQLPNIIKHNFSVKSFTELIEQNEIL